MDPLDLACVNRARTALNLIADSRTGQQAKAFLDIAFSMLGSQNTAHAVEALKRHPDDLVQKAAAHAMADDLWTQDDGAALAAAFLASIAEGSLLDQIAKYASVLSLSSRKVLVASGAVGDVVAEGDPKVVRRLDLALGDIELTKAASIVVLTQELAKTVGGRRLFETELVKAVTRASNQSLLAKLTDSNTIAVAGTGDPLTDLRAGLRAAGPSAGYVVAASAGDVADLATRAENRSGMSIRGGTFVPGVEVVAMDDLDAMHIIPASRLALWDGGLMLNSAGHATVDMADSPESPAQMVNLWQTNSIGLLAERSWHIAGDSTLVIVGEESSSP